MLDCHFLYYLLNIDLNVLLQIVAVQVEDQVMDKVESVTDDDQWQLVGEFSFLSVTHSNGDHIKKNRGNVIKSLWNKWISYPHCNFTDKTDWSELSFYTQSDKCHYKTLVATVYHLYTNDLVGWNTAGICIQTDLNWEYASRVTI